MTDSDRELTIYQVLGESGIARLVTLFYDHMEENPDVEFIRAMHPLDLSESREKFRLFLVGWFGGPQEYIRRFGHPRLRARHLPFPIDSRARDQWMQCMDVALAEVISHETLREQIRGAFAGMADHMRNRPDAI